MNKLDFSDLMNMDKAKLSKMKKEEIIEAIHTYSFYYQNNINAVKEAKEKLIEQSQGEKFAKKMLAAYVGEEKKDGEYDSEYLNRLDLADLVGKTLLKASRY